MKQSIRIKIRERIRETPPRHVDPERLGRVADALTAILAISREPVSKTWLAVMCFHPKSTFAEKFISIEADTFQEAIDLLGERLVRTIQFYEENLSPHARGIAAQVRRILSGEE